MRTSGTSWAGPGLKPNANFAHPNQKYSVLVLKASDFSSVLGHLYSITEDLTVLAN